MGGIPAKYFQHTASRFDTIGTIPEWRLTEVDQTDPAGRWRVLASGDELEVTRALTANWATVYRWLQFLNASELTASASNGAVCSISTKLTATADVAGGVIESSAFDSIFNLALTANNASTFRAVLHDFNLASGQSGNLTGTPGVVGADIDVDFPGTNTYTVTAARGFWVQPLYIGTNVTVTTWCGGYISNASITGTLTNQYGLYIESITGAGTLNRAIFVAGGISEFYGAIQADSTLDLNSVFDQDPAALSGTPATTGAWLDQAAQTFTDNNTAQSGTAAAMVFNAFQAPTLAATNTGVTTTIASTLYIARPIAGTNETLTNRAALWLEGNSIGATPADTLLLWNTTDAAAGAQQYSPALRFHGEGWKTDATAASQNVDWRVYAVPVQGAAAPSTNLLFQSSVNDAAFGTRLTLASGGLLSLTGSLEFTVNANLYAPNIEDGLLYISARDNGVGAVAIAGLIGGANPYVMIGRDDTGVWTAAVTDMLLLQAGAGSNNEAANFGLGISILLGNAASQVEERGSLDLVLTTATDGSEAAEWRFNAMNAGAMVAGLLRIGTLGLGFYNTAPVAQQTGVAVSAAGIHAALVNLGLITA